MINFSILTRLVDAGVKSLVGQHGIALLAADFAEIGKVVEWLQTLERDAANARIDQRDGNPEQRNGNDVRVDGGD